ncbi:MAG TPA: TraR/DksA C4-type zinc finger protein [Anaeromyxobacteraceae bacterium]|jgi:DnaK suppressor protein
MRRQELDRYRAVLSGQLAELLGHGAETVHTMSGEAGEELPDPNDRASREADRSHDLRLRDRDRKLIAKVQEALARIEAGTFGRCESCGGRIPSARLRARPVTTFCIDCKREAEARERA